MLVGRHVTSLLFIIAQQLNRQLHVKPVDNFQLSSSPIRFARIDANEHLPLMYLHWPIWQRWYSCSSYLVLCVCWWSAKLATVIYLFNSEVINGYCQRGLNLKSWSFRFANYLHSSSKINLERFNGRMRVRVRVQLTWCGFRWIIEGVTTT